MASTIMLFMSIPVPALLFPTSHLLQSILQVFFIFINDYLTGGILSPPVALLLSMLPSPYGAPSFMTKPRLKAVLAAHFFTAVFIYDLKKYVFPPTHIFGPSCSSTTYDCAVNEGALTLLLTILCSLDVPSSVPKSLKAIASSARIALSVKLCMVLDGGLSGAGMNPLVPAAFKVGEGDLGMGGSIIDETKIYLVAPVVAATIGCGIVGWIKGKVKQD